MRVGPCHCVCHWLFSYDQWHFPKWNCQFPNFMWISFLLNSNWLWLIQCEKIKIQIIFICDVLKQEVIKAGIKVVQTTIIQIHHITIKVIRATKAAVVAVAATGATMITLDVIISKASVVAQWDQIIIINAAIHMEIITVLQITMASVSTSHFDGRHNSLFFLCKQKKTQKQNVGKEIKPSGCVYLGNQETIKIKMVAVTIKATTMDQWEEETLAVETEGTKKVGISYRCHAFIISFYFLNRNSCCLPFIFRWEHEKHTLV